MSYQIREAPLTPEPAGMPGGSSPSGLKAVTASDAADPLGGLGVDWDIPWLSEVPTAGTVAPGDTAVVAVRAALRARAGSA